MSTTTTRLSLVKPEASDRVAVGAHVSNNMDTLDTNINARVASSATHPASPFTGQIIYEDDTDQLMLWDGTDWQMIGKNSFPKGLIAQTSITANTANTVGTTELDTGIEVSFTAESDRKYMLELTCLTQQTTDAGSAGGVLSFRYRYAAGAAVGTGDTSITAAISSSILQANNLFDRFHDWRVWAPGISGQVTVGVFITGTAAEAYRIVGNATNQIGYLLVRDVGSA